MKIKLTLVAMLMFLPMNSIASEDGNVQACKNSVEYYTGRKVDDTNMEYSAGLFGLRELIEYGNEYYFGSSTITWPEIECEALLNNVLNLTVGDKKYIDDGFHGDSKKRYEVLKTEIDSAVTLLKGRINDLEDSLADAKRELKQPNPQIDRIENTVRDKIKIAKGQRGKELIF